jgi:fructokinase
MKRESHLLGAVEAGGTKFICVIGDESGAIHAETQFPTTAPRETLARARDFLASHGAMKALGIASFGPVTLDPRSANYGFIGPTPKAAWSHVDIVGDLAREFACPVGFDTDVNAAALAERRWGAGRDVDNLAYVTVGTGIGAGVLIRGVPLHGLLHPEFGHLRPRRHALDADFIGVCPFHGDCLEGLASGPAILARSGRELQHLDRSHRQWELQADYLGQLCAQLVLAVSPERIIMGGGVMSQERLLPMVRVRMIHWLGGYVDHPAITMDVDRYLVAPGLAGRAGAMGGLALAIAAISS